MFCNTARQHDEKSKHITHAASLCPNVSFMVAFSTCRDDILCFISSGCLQHHKVVCLRVLRGGFVGSFVPPSQNASCVKHLHSGACNLQSFDFSLLINKFIFLQLSLQNLNRKMFEIIEPKTRPALTFLSHKRLPRDKMKGTTICVHAISSQLTSA